MNAIHTVALVLCTEDDGAMATTGQRWGILGCESCDRVIATTDLQLDAGESLAIDRLDGRAYIIGCPFAGESND